MAIYVKSCVKVTFADDSDLNGISLQAADTVTDSTSFSESTTQKISIANGATDEAINFGGVATGKLLYFKSSVAVSIKLNGSSDALVITAGQPVHLPATITALTVTNSSGSDALIDFGVAG